MPKIRAGHLMWKRLKTKIFYCSLGVFYLAGFCFFYYKYVPLVRPFQAALIPVLITAIVTTVLKVEWGILFFVFALSLINNLPYFFGITLDLPHAPAALVLALAFFFGLLINKLFFNSKLDPHSPLAKPLFLFATIVFISAIITFLRYANFFPFVSSGLYELVVNTNGVRAGGAFMSVIFAALNYLTGIGLFFVFWSVMRGRSAAGKVLFVLSFAMTLSLIFAIVQKHTSINLGNTRFWVFKDQINSTFKDPNAFGAFLAAFFPIFLAMAFFLKGKHRFFSAGLLALTIYVFPWTGLRSGWLAILISLVVFSAIILTTARMRPKKKIAVASSLAVVFILFLTIVFSPQARSILSRRMDWSLSILEGKITLSELFTEKLRLWKVASLMLGDYPLSGVGVGAYIVELPNYSRLIEMESRWTDSAENYFFQVGSELGMSGLFLILWIFYEILKKMRRSWKKMNTEGGQGIGWNDSFIPIGLGLGILAIVLNFLFHSFIGSYEVSYLFWILVALLFGLTELGEKKERKPDSKFKFRLAALSLGLAFGAAHLWNSSHSLSLRIRTERFAFKQDFGFYRQEKDERQFSFRWARKTAGMEMDIYGPTLVLPVMASHPDIQARPLQVRIYLANENFRKKALLKEITLDRKEWQDVELDTSEFLGKKIQLIIETSREWFPYKLGIPDARKLAVALGEEWFRYPKELPAEAVKSIQKIPALNWKTPEGKTETVLYSNGRRKIEFNAEEEAAAIRLFIRGQKAMGLGPFIVIKLDGQTIAKTMLTREEWTPLVLNALKPEIRAGSHTLEVEFTNDLHKPELRQDRNVFLGDVEVINLK
ncbi:MAG: O-antigen ligase family protein [Candidatus Aminicenantales bacterium]